MSESKDVKYCHKCHLKTLSGTTKFNVKIFNEINNIIFCSDSMPDVYSKMSSIKLSKNLTFEDWLETNEEGYTVFHWFIWFMSSRIKKFYYIRSRVYAFLQKIFGDNTIKSIFNDVQILKIVNITIKGRPNHTLLYHLIRYCENSNDVFYKRTYNMLVKAGATLLSEEQIKEIKTFITEEEDFTNNIQMKTNISMLTKKYKECEKLIINNIEYINKKNIITNDVTCDIVLCSECGSVIDFTKDIPKIIDFIVKLHDEKKLTMIVSTLQSLIINAYYARKVLNSEFNSYYKLKKQNHPDLNIDLNMIHKRHSHVINIYESCKNFNKIIGNDINVT